MSAIADLYSVNGNDEDGYLLSLNPESIEDYEGPSDIYNILMCDGSGSMEYYIGPIIGGWNTKILPVLRGKIISLLVRYICLYLLSFIVQ